MTRDRNTEALKLRGKKSTGLIARELGVTRGVVAGIFFRQSHPGLKMTGTGRGRAQNRKPAAEVLRSGGGQARAPGPLARPQGAGPHCRTLYAYPV